MTSTLLCESRDRRDQKFRFDTDTDTFSGSRSIPRLILILKVDLNRDRYWYWYQENVPGLILIPRLYLIRILPKPYKKCTSLWIDTGTDTKGLCIGLFNTIPIFLPVSGSFQLIVLQLTSKYEERRAHMPNTTLDMTVWRTICHTLF